MRWGRVAKFAVALSSCGSPVVTAVSAHPAAADAPQFPGGGVLGFGDAATPGTFSGMSVNSPLEAMASTSDGQGYWVAAADGGVFAFGDARFYGSMGNRGLYAPIVGMASPNDRGYWLVALDGGIFSFGDAPFYGSMGATPLAQPIAGMAATPDGGGYWLVAEDGGIFSFGDARFYGSMGGQSLAAPISGMASTPDGRGYWLIGSDGGVFAFGDAQYFGSAANQNIGTWVPGIAATKDGKGYWLGAATAGVLAYGDATFMGPSPNEPPFSPTGGIVATPDAKGYWLLQPDDVATTFAGAGGTPGGQQAAQIAASQIGPNPDAAQGPYCNPYGPCEEWCALFATWAWNSAGIPVPRYAFTGDLYNWAAARGMALPANAAPAVGDGILFGTGPQNSSTSTHMAIVTETWPDGAVITVDGDSGPEPDGQDVVSIDGPFLPTDAGAMIGMPVYALVRP